MADCQIYTFGKNPGEAYSHALRGFEKAAPVWPETLTPLVRGMIEAFGATPDSSAPFWGLSEEAQFLLEPNGRLALIGRAAPGCKYVVELP